MKLEITKSCADSLRAFIQDNYGIHLKSSHAHELVAAYFGYHSRAALIADNECPVRMLKDAKLIILNHPTQRIEERLKTLANLPLGLPSSDIITEIIYKTIATKEQLVGKVWTDFKEMAIAYAEDRIFHNERMIGITGGFNQSELDWLIEVNIETEHTDVLMTVTYDYPPEAKKPLRHASVSVTLPRKSGNIGYGEPKVLPTFYKGHMSDPDFRLKHNID